MHVWVCYNTIWTPNPIDSNKAHEHMKTNLSKRPFKNFFLLSGQIAVYDALPQITNKDSLE